MIVNKIENGSVVELTTAHKLGGDCTCGATVSAVATKDGSGYAKYNYSKVYTHKSETKKSFTEEFFEEFAKRFPGEI
jgi:hypothetical protein